MYTYLCFTFTSKYSKLVMEMEFPEKTFLISQQQRIFGKFSGNSSTKKIMPLEKN